jgi:hypothetical protein
MKQTGRVAQDAIAFAQWARRGTPASGDSRCQQFISVRAMIPDGDRRDLALSGGPQNQRQSTSVGTPRRDHIMCVFIQGECFDKQYRRTLRAPPQDELLQRPESRKFAFESSHRFDWEV